jgi:hypothetical protein
MPKKIEKPTVAQQMIINKRLRAKYPQMYKAGWGKPKPSKAGAKSGKTTLTPQQRKSGAQLLIDYAKGNRGFKGASGSDLKALQKMFGKSKRK